MSDPREEFPDLMRRVREGDGEAAQVLYDRYGAQILKVVRRRLHQPLRSRFDSEDFVQSTLTSFFVTAIQNHQFDTPEELAAFLKKMALFKVAGAYRKGRGAAKRDRSRERSLHEPLEEGGGAPQSFLSADGSTPSQKAVANERWEQLQQGQSPVTRKVLALLREGHTHEEIARILGLHPKTIQRQLRRIDQGRTT